MHLPLFVVGLVFSSVASAIGSTDFSGTWVLDLKASSSPEPILKRLGASWIERTLGSSVQLESTYIQTPSMLTAGRSTVKSLCVSLVRKIGGRIKKIPPPR
ncbi:MAG TPA: hypothetical protein VE242_04825 [Chthoniobacterales bacterium]|nr:hypothetical protein [Chthoniobacterales bacterium]